MNKKILIFSLFLFLNFCVNTSLASPMTLESLMDRIQANQSKINDMYAETKTTISSGIQISSDSETKTMVQTGKMWTRGADYSKIEMISPVKQVTIRNKDKMAIIDPATGQKTIQDLAKLREQGVSGPGEQAAKDLQKLKEYFDLSLSIHQSSITGRQEYVITGVPRNDNKIINKMELYIDTLIWAPVKIIMYGPRDKLINSSKLEYKDISGIRVLEKNSSTINTPMGTMNVIMEYLNVEINKGIDEAEFSF